MNPRILLLVIQLAVSAVLYAQSPRPSCEMYCTKDKAFFYDQVFSAGRPAYIKRKAYLVFGDRFWVTCKMIDYDWVYVTFRNRKGVITKGYMRSSDMDQIER